MTRFDFLNLHHYTDFIAVTVNLYETQTQKAACVPVKRHTLCFLGFCSFAIVWEPLYKTANWDVTVQHRFSSYTTKLKSAQPCHFAAT